MADATHKRFLVIGCGSIGKRHLKNLKSAGVRQLLAFDVREDRRQEVEKEIGAKTYSDLEKAYLDGVDVAVICSPTRFHMENCLQAAQKGCHLFVEKPVSDSMDGVPELLKEIEKRQLKTLVGCNFRFEPALVQVKKLLEQGLVGRVVSARAQFGQYLPDWHPWEDYRQGYSANRKLGGGVILDRIHELDYMRWLLGDVKSVFSLAGHLTSLEIDTEDTAQILLHFSNGSYGSIHLDYVRRTYDCSLEIIGEKGTILWRYQNHRVEWYLASDKKWQTKEWENLDPNTPYLEQTKHFLDVLDGKVSSAQDCKSAVLPLRMALAAKKSAETGQMYRLDSI